VIINLNRPERGDIAFKQFTFPDGQPHCEFDPNSISNAAALGPIDVVTSIQSGNDLLAIGLALEALKSIVCNPPVRIRLNISYLLGARMDRRIALGRPATLAVIAAMIKTWQSLLDEVRVLDVHSSMSKELLPTMTALLPDALLRFALQDLDYGKSTSASKAQPLLVIPDAGAVTRVLAMMERLGIEQPVARCVKKRDSQTGKLSGFELIEGDVQGRSALIVDDICDGGGTFSGISKILRAAGASKVSLCVTHGVFSKGLNIEGVDQIYCTDSYSAKALQPEALIDSELTMQTERRLGFDLLSVFDGQHLKLTQIQGFVANLLYSGAN
jgi:ribose-phosphate pyrophosphokinase